MISIYSLLDRHLQASFEKTKSLFSTYRVNILKSRILHKSSSGGLRLS